MKRVLGIAAGAGLVLGAVGANYATAHFGMVALPFGAAVSAGTFAAGWVLILRDAVHEFGGRLAVLAAIAAAGVASWVTSPGFLALASTVAFVLAEVLDWAVYSPLRRRGWARAVMASSLAAAPVDTLIFLSLAGFPITAGAVIGQTAIKVTCALIAVGVVGVVLRHRVVARNA